MVVMRAGKKEEVWQKSWCGETFIIINRWCCGEGGSMMCYMWQRHWCRQLSLSFRSTHNNTMTQWKNTQKHNYTTTQWYNDTILNKTLCSVDISVDVPQKVTLRSLSGKTVLIRIESGCGSWTMDGIEPKLGSISSFSLIVTNLLLLSL